MTFTPGQKVTVDNTQKIYDFGYYGQPGYAVIYEEGERNMQDSFVISLDRIRPEKEKMVKQKRAREISVKKTFEQEEDSCGRTGETHQYLEVETQDAGGGNYIVIQTDRWAIDLDEIDEFCELLRGFSP